MTVMDAEGIYAAGGPSTLRMATRGAVRVLQREGRMDAMVPDVAVPLTRLANRLRATGEKAAANSILEHAVHDGVPATALAEAVQVATGDDFRGQFAPPPVQVGPNGELRVGPPPAADDLASTIELANYVRDRILTY